MVNHQQATHEIVLQLHVLTNYSSALKSLVFFPIQIHTGTCGDTSADPADELGEWAPGCALYPWRPRDARGTCLTYHRRKIHSATARFAFAHLAYLPTESPPRTRCQWY
jgi:hypothetical protein